MKKGRDANLATIQKNFSCITRRTLTVLEVKDKKDKAQWTWIWYVFGSIESKLIFFLQDQINRR